MASRAEGKFVNPVSLEGVADIERRWDLIDRSVAQRRIRHVVDGAIRRAVHQRLRERIIELEREAGRHALAEVELEGIVERTAAVGENERPAAGYRRIHDEQIRRVTGLGE